MYVRLFVYVCAWGSAAQCMGEKQVPLGGGRAMSCALAVHAEEPECKIKRHSRSGATQ